MKIERVCAIATVIAVVPVWLFRWFPTQDGPSHLYNAYVLSHYYDASSTLVRMYLDVNLRPFPNWTTYALMALLVRVFPPLIVQQIVISTCIISVPAAVVYLQKSFRPSAVPSALISILLALSYVLFMGFFNFIIGSALFAVALGYWWRRRNFRYLYGLYGLLIAIYLSHDLAFAATLLAIGILAAVERRWRVFAELAPAFLIFLLDALTRPHSQQLFRSFRWHLRHLLSFLASGHIVLAIAAIVIVVVGIVFSFIRSRPSPVAIVSAILFLAYFVAPWGYSGEGWVQAGWLNERLLFLTVLTLPAWIVLPRPAIAMTLLAAVIAGNFALTFVEIAKSSAYIGEVIRCAPLIRSHSTIHTYFSKSSVRPDVTPTLHLTGYLGLKEDVVDLDNYEAYLPDFPLAYRNDVPSRPPDYVVVWRGTNMGPIVGYRLIFENEAIRLYHVPGS